MVKPSGGGARESENQVQHEATSRFGRMATASGAAPFSMQFKSKYNTALSWGRNEMNSAQSLQKSENQVQHKAHIASAAWNSLLAVLGSGPFSV